MCRIMSALCALLATLHVSTVSSQSTTCVSTNYGVVCGQFKDGARAFTKIPYAKPPIPSNSLRFAKPEAPDPWGRNFKNATEVAPSCMTDCEPNDIGCYKYLNDVGMSEDCLYLNIWTPSLSDVYNDTELEYLYGNNSNVTEADLYEAMNLPVMIFIHGGAYLYGWSGSPLYDGTNLAIANKVIIVSINYRLGVFGFLYDETLGLEGNYGYFDQLFAIKFVYENIQHFGGDNSRIVLFGESAGAMSVGTILLNATNEVSDYFMGAIMESNPFGTPYPKPDTFKNQYSAARCLFYEDLVDTDLGCSHAESLVTKEELTSTKTAEEILAAQTDSTSSDDAYGHYFECGYYFDIVDPWAPVFNTPSLPQDNPITAFKNGDFNTKVQSIMIGTNRNEGVLFTFQGIDKIKWAGITHERLKDDIIEPVFGACRWRDIKTQYNIEQGQSDTYYADIAAEIITDALFTCPSRLVAQYISEQSESGVEAYLYNYNYLYSNSSVVFPETTQCQQYETVNPSKYVCHEDEVPIVFKPKSSDFKFSEREAMLSSTIQAYWTDVAKAARPRWPNYDSTNEYSLLVSSDATTEVVQHYSNENHHCEYWDTTDYCWINNRRVGEKECGVTTNGPCYCSSDDETDGGVSICRGLVGLAVIAAIFVTL